MFLITSAILVAIPYATDLTSTKAGAGVSFYVIVGVLCLLGAITAISQSAVFAYMSVLPERYMAICSTGFGISGILQNAIRAMILLSFEDQQSASKEGTLIYYYISAAILAFAAGLYFIERRNEYAQDRIKRVCILPDVESDRKPCCYRFTLFYLNSKEPLNKSFKHLFHLFFSMLVSFVVFPGVMQATTVAYPSNRAWFELSIVTLFNVFDTLGRYIGGVEMFMFKARGCGIHLVGFGRILGIVIAILIMIKTIGGDFAVYGNTVAFAITNGYIQTICCCHAASLVDEHESNALGNLITVAITVGVSVGGLLQIPLARLAPETY